MTHSYDDALKLEPRLTAVERMVDTVCLYVRPTDEFCHACYWESVLKPIVTDLVGWGRGYPPEQADPNPRSSWAPIDLADLPDPTPAENDAEKWLRSSEAFDLVTDELLRRLYDADPGNGHGFRRVGP